VEEMVANIFSVFREFPIVEVILIIVLVVSILLLIFTLAVWRRVQDCYKEQKRLTVYFEDQMFLLGKFHEELASFKRILLGRKETLPERENLESFTRAIPLEEGAKSKASAIRPAVTPESTSAPSPREEGNHIHQIEEGKSLIKKKVEEIAREFNIQIKEVDWYKKPSMLSKTRYILMILLGDKPMELGLSEKEIADFHRNDEAIQNRVRSLMKEIQEIKESAL
jgi:hypothetical protein